MLGSEGVNNKSAKPTKVFFVDEDLVPSLVAKMSLETGRLEKQQGTVLITHGFAMHADPGAQRPNYPKKVSCREAKQDGYVIHGHSMTPGIYHLISQPSKLPVPTIPCPCWCC
jgi:hypothetical protein